MKGEENSTRLRDVIKAIRSCKTAAEERNVISEESARIRASFRQENCPLRHRNVAKLIFFHMLGYNTQFAHIECLKLIVSKRFIEKKVGYLALVQLMAEEDELALMAISSVKADLASEQHNIVGMALCAVANAASSDMCREVARDILRLIGGSKHASIKGKAILAAARVVRKCPDLVEDFLEPALALVEETHTQTLGTAVSLMLEILKQDGEKVDRFATFVGTFERSLRNLMHVDGQFDLAIHGIVDPFTQCRLIEMLRIIGRKGPAETQQFESLLGSIISSTELTKQTGRSLVYECCRTLLELSTSASLRAQALNTLDSLIISKENNTRYAALKALTREAAAHPDSVLKFRTGVLGCLQDPDLAVATMAVELLVMLVNTENVKTIMRDLLHLLETTDNAELKETIATKICLVAELHKYDQNWYLETMVKVLELTKSVGEDTICRVLNTILSASELHEYAVKVLFFSVKSHPGQEALITLGLWCIGEYADLLINSRQYGSLPASPSASEVIDLIQGTFTQNVSAMCKQYALTAIVKVAVRIPSEASSCRYVLEGQSLSPALELQQRACEYLVLLDASWEDLRAALFVPMPAFEKDAVRLPVPVSAVRTEEPVIAQTQPAQIATNLLEMDLLGDMIRPQATSHQPAPTDISSLEFQPPSNTPFVLKAYNDSYIVILFNCVKEDPSHPEVTTIYMSTSTQCPYPITNVKILPLAPKNLRVSLFPASETTLQASQPLTQVLKVTNLSHGDRPIALKLKIEYDLQGATQKGEQVVSNFPVSY